MVSGLQVLQYKSFVMSMFKDPSYAALIEAGVNADTLVVKSQPFGELVDAQTRKVFTPPLGDLAYPICRAIKSFMYAEQARLGAVTEPSVVSPEKPNG